MYGYYTPSGYMGRLHDGSWRLFATQEDYIEYMKDE